MKVSVAILLILCFAARHGTLPQSATSAKSLVCILLTCSGIIGGSESRSSAQHEGAFFRETALFVRAGRDKRAQIKSTNHSASYNLRVDLLRTIKKAVQEHRHELVGSSNASSLPSRRLMDALSAWFGADDANPARMLTPSHHPRHHRVMNNGTGQETPMNSTSAIRFSLERTLALRRSGARLQDRTRRRRKRQHEDHNSSLQSNWSPSVVGQMSGPPPHVLSGLKSNQRPIVITRKTELRKDWCRTEPLKQKVREKGCVSKTIVNQFCYGQCNSFYIPRLGRGGKNSSAFQSCAFCKPYRLRWISVRLQCPGKMPPFKRKRIQVVAKCRCLSEILR